MTSTLFVIVAAIVLFGTVVLDSAAKAGAEFPGWLAVDAERSVLEGRNYAQFPGITWKSLAEGRFQGKLEKYLSDAVPMRDFVLLGNAALQRGSIALARIPFGYAAYHTYFGSERLYLPDSNALMRVPLNQVQEYDGLDIGERLDAVASGLANVAGRYPEKRFVMLVVDHSYTSACNPASELVSGFWSTSDIAYRLSAGLGEVQNVSIISRPLSEQEVFFQEYFKTDHHWSIVGAARACNLILDELERDPFDGGGLLTVGDFMGTNARSGLLPLEETMLDFDHDFGGLELVSAEGGSEAGNQHSFYYGASSENRLFNSYGLWYGQSDSYTEIRSNGKGVALLISDSYGNALRRPLAEGYASLMLANDFTYSSESDDERLVSKVANSEVEDIIMVACAGNILTLTDRFPCYFD